MVVPTATVIASSAALVPRNALVSRDLANFLVGYAEVTRWGMLNGARICGAVIKT
jgi:hypothetical protein